MAGVMGDVANHEWRRDACNIGGKTGYAAGQADVLPRCNFGDGCPRHRANALSKESDCQDCNHQFVRLDEVDEYDCCAEQRADDQRRLACCGDRYASADKEIEREPAMRMPSVAPMNGSAWKMPTLIIDM